MPKSDTGEISNSTIYELIANKVLPALEEFNLHLTKINGRVDQLEDRRRAHTNELRCSREERAEIERRLTRVEAVTEVRDQHQEKELDEAKRERQGFRQELIQIGKELARIGAGAGLAALIIKLLGEVRP